MKKKAEKIKEEFVSQSEAARRVNRHRMRISQLVKKGRVELNDEGEVKLSDVVRCIAEAEAGLNKGRPAIPDKPSAYLGTGFGFKTGDAVAWTFKPKDGFGKSVTIAPAKVERIGASRVKVSFKDESGEERQVWVRPEELAKSEEKAPSQRQSRGVRAAVVGRELAERRA